MSTTFFQLEEKCKKKDAVSLSVGGVGVPSAVSGLAANTNVGVPIVQLVASPPSQISHVLLSRVAELCVFD